MAGSSSGLPLPNPNNGRNNNSGQWLIHYARFFNFPTLKPTSSALVPVTRRFRKSGTWLSTSPSMVSLQLLQHQIHAESDASRLVLLISFQGKIYEEHCISKLHFSWPQISCMEATSLKGSRAVFASYGDSKGQVQKFAMQFPTCSEAQAFMCSLKTSLNGIGSIGVDGGNISSELPSTSQFISRNGLSNSTSQEMSNMYPIGNYQPQMQGLPNYRFTRYAPSDATHPTHDSEARSTRLPPSSNALMQHTNIDRHQELPRVPDLLDSIYNYHKQGAKTDPKFFAMLGNLELMMSELGGDLSLSL